MCWVLGPGYWVRRLEPTQHPTPFRRKKSDMCRSIKTLRRREEPATDEEVRAAALQFVRKISGYREPSLANEEAFFGAVDDISAASHELLSSLKTRRTLVGHGAS